MTKWPKSLLSQPGTPRPRGTRLRRALNVRPSRVAALALITCGLFFLASRIISQTTANAFATSDPQRALRWDGDNAAALVALAGQRLGNAEPQGTAQTKGQSSPRPTTKVDLAPARQLAQKALRFDPLVQRALTELARIADAADETQRAPALMALAAERDVRDADAQGWLVDHALSRGDFATALAHLDAILRLHPEALDKALPLLTAFVSNPEAAAPLARFLRSDPPWRDGFLSSVSAHIGDRAALGRLYAELQAGQHPLSQQELQPYLDRLAKDGLFKDAYEAWAESLPAPRRPLPDTLYNGAFQYPLSGSEFDWKIEQSLGADVEIVGGAGEGPQSLRVEFSGARVAFQNVSHLLVLRPGTYRLSGEVEAEALHTERGLWWRLFCANAPNESMGQTDLVADSMPWRAFTLAFAVPATNCQAQVLRLELPAQVALEQAIAGIVSYRNLAIVALGPTLNAEGQRDLEH